MDAGLAVVLAVLGVFLLVPLALAWVSTDPRRWARIEGLLGREPKGSQRWARWAIWLWLGIGVAYLALGIVQFLTGPPTELEWLSLALGVLYLVNGGAQYLIFRNRRRAERSVQPQVQDRAEPGRPGAGG
jgi:hypothetical protein